MRKECSDHLGNKFKSKLERARFYKKPHSAINYRLNSGYTLEEALTIKAGKLSKNECKDHLGNVYESYTARAAAYGLTRARVAWRLRSGMSIKDALTLGFRYNIVKECADHLGNKYHSYEARARAYGISNAVIRYRLKAGWSLEKALLTQPVHKKRKAK